MNTFRIVITCDTEDGSEEIHNTLKELRKIDCVRSTQLIKCVAMVLVHIRADSMEQGQEFADANIPEVSGIKEVKIVDITDQLKRSATL